MAVSRALRFRSAFAALLLVFVASCAQLRAGESGSQFVVAAAHPLAVDAGYEVLRRGGSALDAAIAVQMVLGLVEPESSGVGGGAFLLYWSESDKTLRSYDGRETAPAAARPDRFLGQDRKPISFVEAVVGGRSVGVPGVLRMLELAHARHGRLPWRELFAPAITAAQEGFPLSPRLHALLERETYLASDPEARRIFYPDGKAKAAGARIVNPDYASTLRRVAEQGVDAFYRGQIAKDMVRAVRSHAKPGDLTEQDLAGYRALEREPLCGPYRQWRVCSMAPPSAGGIAVLQILGILERTTFARAPPLSADAVHLLSEAGRLAYADRAKYLGDPDFVSVPTKKLLDRSYLDRRARLIGERSMRTALPGDTEAAGTSHISIVDAQGNVASMTTTIEATFGSRIMVRGFLLNNELTDFSAVWSASDPNRIEPGKRPRSSISPTIVLRHKKPLLALGSPGGSTIITTVLQLLVDRLDRGMSLADAIAAPRVAPNNTTPVKAEQAYLDLYQAGLTALGHTLTVVGQPGTSAAEIGAATGIEFGPHGLLTAAAEPTRRGGGAADVVEPRSVHHN
jgi:gamma-glutamyltranspeptidase/glutathione hydrolase